MASKNPHCKDCDLELDGPYILNNFKNKLCLACWEMRRLERGAVLKELKDVDPVDAPLGYLFVAAKSEERAKSLLEYQFDSFDKIKYNYDTGELEILLEQ